MAQFSDNCLMNFNLQSDEEEKRVKVLARKSRRRRFRLLRKKTKFFKRLKSIRSSIKQRKAILRKMSQDFDQCNVLVRPTDKVWQHVDELAYWKSRAISLEYENNMLHEHMKRMYINNVGTGYTAQEPRQIGELDEQPDNAGIGATLYVKDGDCDQEEFEEMDEDYEDDPTFNLESKRFREERNRARQQAELTSVPRESSPDVYAMKQANDKRMKELYGKQWRKIMGMEIACKLNYDLYLDRHDVQYWPVIPMNY